MSTKKIYKVINDVMVEIGAIGKNGKNKQQNYAYRTIDDMYNAFQPAFSKHGLCIVPEITHREELKLAKGYKVMLTVKYHLFADDGSSIESVVQGESIDFSDKATNKAMTAAFKYMCIQVFCIAVEGTADADADTPEMVHDKEPKKKTLEAPKKNPVPELFKLSLDALESKGKDKDWLKGLMKSKFGHADPNLLGVNDAQKLLNYILEEA